MPTSRAGVGILVLAFVVLYLVRPCTIEAKIPDGIPCSNCHTMHYSQDASLKPSWGKGGPYEFLLTDDCIGCHSNTNAETIVNFTPIVYNTVQPTAPLAGGNFYYVNLDDANGHNLQEIGNPDDNLISPPGAVHAGQIGQNELTCAGNNGCHGVRNFSQTIGFESIRGAHHANLDGKLDQADTLYSSYRMLNGVKGYESPDWSNTDSNSHNEYYASTSPLDTSTCSACHAGGNIGIKPTNQTISGFCATCHGNFHSIQGIGGDNTSPFTRHPTDVILPNSGEYTSFTSYNINAPVGRTTVPDAPLSTVTPGSDTVICLSCHEAHGSPYYKMLRWDYRGWPGNGQTLGCSICHASEN